MPVRGAAPLLSAAGNAGNARNDGARDMLRRFEVQKFLGKGSYGSVCVGSRRRARADARSTRGAR